MSKVQINYLDERGQPQFETASAEDISPIGCRVLLRFRCQPRSVVSFRFTPAIAGSATVRYQRATARGYRTGLEFLSELALLPDGIER